MARLPRSFYNRPTLKVAQDLLGQLLYRKCRMQNSKCKIISGVIAEVEAYIGKDDPACHACKGLTPRTEVMFGPPGHAYVYFIYGMYHCLNIVTEKENFPAAVLIRAVVPVSGIEVMRRNRRLKKSANDDILADGPGKLCQAFKIDKSLNGTDVVCGKKLWVERSRKIDHHHIKKTPRIGIREAKNRKWRFLLE